MTVSGGEVQRVKLSRELSKRGTDLEREGGDEGGQVVAAGRPEEVAATPTSYTGQFLRRALKA